MSSPTLSSMCCWFRNASMAVIEPMEKTGQVDWQLTMRTYNCLSIISAIVSILGASVQLFPRRPPSTIRTPADVISFRRQNTVIFWLAVADFLASVMILARASVWLSGYIPWSHESTGDAAVDGQHIFCAVSSAFIQYFYTSTYFWTFSYALDVYLRVNSQPCLIRLYHFLGWVLPAVLVTVGLSALYLPDITSCHHGIARTLPLYLFSYVPILIVMVANPLFYYFISKTVRDNLRALGIYTDDERKRLAMLRSRFFCVTLAFYICWSANILNGVLLSFHEHIDNMGVYLAIWAYMAVVNPLQAFLNSLVYRGVGGCNIKWDLGVIITTKETPRYMGSRWRYKNRRADIQHNSTTDLEDSVQPTERSSLLSFRT